MGHSAILLALFAALANALVLAVRLPTLIASTWRYGDLPELTFIAQALSSGNGPQHRQLQSSVAILWLDQLLASLPFRYFLEYCIGPALTIIASILVLRAARSVAGRRAWLISALLLTVLPPVVLWCLLFPDNHGTTWVGMALLGWVVVRDVKGAVRWRTRLATGLICGLFSVSDPQLVVSGVVPYLLTSALIRWRAGSMSLRPALGTVAGIAIGSAVTLGAMYVQGIHFLADLPGTPLIDSVARGTQLAVQTLGWVATGGWYGDALTAAELPLVAVFLIAIVVLVAVAANVVRALADRPHAQDTALLRYRCFWSLAIAGLLLAFLTSGYANVPISGHYLVPCYLAACALASTAPGVLARLSLSRAVRRWPKLALMSACLCYSAFAAHTAFASATVDPMNFNDHRVVAVDSDPLQILMSHHLHRGYAGYWLAYDLDWRSEGALEVWPVLAAPAGCAGNDGALCAYPYAPQGEYAPRGSATFIVTRTGDPNCIPGEPPVALFGAPSATYRVGTSLISVYPYDVASRFSRATQRFC